MFVPLTPPPLWKVIFNLYHFSEYIHGTSLQTTGLAEDANHPMGQAQPLPIPAWNRNLFLHSLVILYCHLKPERKEHKMLLFQLDAE